MAQCTAKQFWAGVHPFNDTRHMSGKRYSTVIYKENGLEVGAWDKTFSRGKVVSESFSLHPSRMVSDDS
jgi:hypothetical protein